MRRLFAFTILLLPLTMLTAGAQSAGDAASTPLPIKRVVLYKAGIGYFEHVGSVTGHEDVTISFTSGQLDDALKSLTAVDLGAGRVTGIRYNSVAPIGERLRALRLPLGEQTSLRDVLGALRGARVSVRSGAATVTGRLVSLDHGSRVRDGHVEPTSSVVVAGDGGELRSFEVTPALAITIADADLRRELEQYLRIVGSAREGDVRRMTVSTAGTGRRSLLVSYISEVPVWKVSYRLILDSSGKQKPLLQGWAVVDNTVGEDWQNVELSLVAGAPQSFIQHISRPMYSRRPVVPVSGAMLLTPQTHGGTLREVAPVAEQLNVHPEAKESGGTGGGVMRRAPGGVLGGVVGGVPEAPAPPPPPSAADAMRQMAADADAQPLGDVFEYRIREPITIRRNESALVPIARAEVEIEKVSLWTARGHGHPPMRALWLTNTSGLTLDGGTFSTIEDGAFAGEGLVETIKPGERRLLSYASDLGLRIDARPDPEPARILRVRAQRGVLIVHREARQRRTYTIRNDNDEARTVIVEHPTRAGWRTTASAPLVESAAGAARFRIEVEPHETATLTVTEVRPEETGYRVGQVSASVVKVLIEGGLPPAAVEQALAPLLAKRAEIDAVSQQIAAREQEIETIERDQARVRENIKALGSSRGDRGLLDRYTRQLSAQEDRLEALRRELAQLTGRVRSLEAEAEQLIEAISLEGDDGAAGA
jgi:hypothetical protein